MLIILIMIGAFAILGGILTWLNWRELDMSIFAAFFTSLVSAIPCFLIGGIISMYVFGPAPMECKYKQELVAMKDTSTVSGSFFLGTGRVNSDMCYIYLVDTDKGLTTKTLKQKSNEVYIKYTDGQPYLEYWSGVDDLWRLQSEFPYYIFYLPDGSVINNVYEIDLE